MQNVLPKIKEDTENRANALHVLLPSGDFTTAEVIEQLPEIQIAHLDRDPFRGGVLS